MKKIVVTIMALALMFAFTACGGSAPSGNQEITFQGITMEIPAAWELEEDTAADDYAVYEQKSKEGHAYRLTLQDTFGLLDTYHGDLDAAGAELKVFAEDDASYSDVGDPVAGKLAGKYDMHVITCTYNMINPTAEDAEAHYPCKLVRIYMGDHDVEMIFSTAEGDFDAFDAAIEAATCN